MPPRLREQLNTLIASINSAASQISRSGIPSSSLNDFQSSLAITVHGIESTFNSYTRKQGPPFEDGDYTSNAALATCLRTLRDTIEPSFRDFCDGRGGPRITEASRLTDLINQYKMLEVEAVDIMSELSFRLATGVSSLSGPSSSSTTTTAASPTSLSSASDLRRALQAQRFSPPSSFLPRPDSSPSGSSSTSSPSFSDSRIREMREHMQNSWIELERNGEVYWVNKWDPREERRSRPLGGFVLREGWAGRGGVSRMGRMGRIGGEGEGREEGSVDEVVERLARGWAVGWRDDGRESRERARRWQGMGAEEQRLRRARRAGWMGGGG